MKPIFKNIILGITCMALAFSQATAQESETLFKKANALYERQAYDSAFTLYQELLDQGYQNKELFLNIGNTCFKGGKYSLAAFYYAKGNKFHPGNKELKHNFQLAQSLASNRTNQFSPLFFVEWWHIFLKLLSPNTWLLLSILFLWIFLFLIGYSGLKNRNGKGRVIFRNFLGLLFLLTFIGAVFSYKSSRAHDKAIIISTDTGLREAPDESSASVNGLQNAAEVKIEDTVGEWLKIKMKDGTQGWVNKKDLKIL